jgi:cytochrome c-type biogenesis protein CcmF
LPKLKMTRGEVKEIGPYSIRFDAFESLTVEEMPDSAIVGVRAMLMITDTATGEEIQAKPSYAIIATGEERYSMSQPVLIDKWNLIVRFDEINPNSDQITLSFRGDRVPAVVADDWVLVVADKKPFISFVWLGTFLLMAGFSVSIMRRWSDLRKKKHLNEETA